MHAAIDQNIGAVDEVGVLTGKERRYPEPDG